MESRYGENDLLLLLGISSFLDPRFKLDYITDEEIILEAVEEQMVACFSENPSPSSSSTIDLNCNDDEEPPTKKTKGLGGILFGR